MSKEPTVHFSVDAGVMGKTTLEAYTADIEHKARISELKRMDKTLDMFGELELVRKHIRKRIKELEREE